MKIIKNPCQWIGSIDDPPCTNGSVQYRSYCTDHVWRIYQKGTEQRRRNTIQKQTSVEFWEDLFNQAASELDAEETS
jgi:hypothetical protein